MSSKEFFRLVVRFFTTRFYTNETVVLLLHKANIPQTSPVKIIPATSQNVTDILSFQSQRKLDIVRDCMKQGDVGYLAYLNEKCVHRSFVSQGPRRILLHKFIPMEIGANEIFIHLCETDPGARGQNIFAHVLVKIAEDFKEKKIWISANAENKSSLRSMEKAGFVPFEKKRIVVILGIKWRQTRVL
jgi:hypothetical protein